ncbi:aromatic amino acid ammonia-lyase [Paraliomyxa miuraensis]|uniref:aromatic amino acid ammonia-lyase n=1 Tax=Paraliomyxa miuraensis TaxID=376150 RepID=UPI00224E9B00|nr:aromatic amino acid ammonia-lyase [Paraliomyxa miuraensis]MCX4241664.1 aromatic amino acid ammonia-lyase [Paraliomyxa miuraensis]
MVSESAVLFKLGTHPVTPSDVVGLADGRYRAVLDEDDAHRKRLRRGAEIVTRRLEAGDALTGLLDGTEHQPDDAWGLIQRHTTATEPMLRDRESAAVLAVRLVVLARGYSGVRLEVLELLCELLNRRVLPRIPASTPGSGDGGLVPMSYVAATLLGKREVSYLGRVVLATEGLRAARLQPVELRPREAMAIMSGTSMATGLGCLGWDRARRLARFSTALIAMAYDVTQGNPRHLDPRLDGLKPHEGVRTAAQWLREDIEQSKRGDERKPVDPGVLRCAPQVLGVLVDAARSTAATLEVELASVSDAPVVHPTTGELLVGGNSHGAHVAYVLDGLKSAVAATASLLECSLALVCDPDASRGLPRDLVADPATGRPGFRSLRSSAAGLAAQVRKHALPGTGFLTALGPEHDLPCPAQLAAIDCLRVLSLAETIASIVALAMCQAVDLRDGQGCHRRASALYGAVRQLVPMLTEDRAQDRDVVTVLELFRAGLLPLGSFD